MSGLGFERELRETERWSVCIEMGLDPPRIILPELRNPIAVGAARKVSCANLIPKAEEDVPARQPGMGVWDPVEKWRFHGAYEFRMAHGV